MQCSTGTARNARVTARSLRSPYRRILWTTPRTRAHNARMHTTLISSCAPHDADHGGVCSAVCHAPHYSHAGCTSQRIARVIPFCIARRARSNFPPIAHMNAGHGKHTDISTRGATTQHMMSRLLLQAMHHLHVPLCLCTNRSVPVAHEPLCIVQVPRFRRQWLPARTPS